MRILIANKFYYNRGGDCIYAINLEKILASRGHEVAFFAMQYPDNLPSKWSKYWPSEVSFKPGPKIFGAFARPFGIGEVKTKFAALLEDFKPDVVHLGNIHSQLSPVIA
ncbi:MAG: glycosyltransferase, partial [Muribaculaceae bacterium]|nr:glycosyltransferase [Muribaculaceae bacterium]